MKNVVNLKHSAPQGCNLQNYSTMRMECPVENKVKSCYFIPLCEIESFSHNPARTGGTQPQNVTRIFDSLVTDPGGQLEPICLEWNPATGKFDIVFGCHREWATRRAYGKGLAIANHPLSGVKGIWATIFTGTPAARTALQMRENGNKLPSSPATKDEMVNMLRKFISQGGLDIGYPTPFKSLSDKEKYDRARQAMKQISPTWAGNKFKGLWNKLNQNGNSSVGLSFGTYGKEKLAQYFCNNNPYGISESDLEKKLSGTVLEKDDKVYAIYFVNQKSEMAGALPTNTSRSKKKNGIDHLIIVAALNDSTTANIAESRVWFEDKAKSWNEDIARFKVFDEIFWMPQTEKERDAHILSGTWARRQKL